MTVYTKEEAFKNEILRRAWLEKLTSIQTKRINLKDTLLTPLKQPKGYSKFLELRGSLLKNPPTWDWEPHWLWDIIAPLILLFKPTWSKPEGSRLRKALETVPEPSLALLSLEDRRNLTVGNVITEAATYEEAVFIAPKDALIDVCNRLADPNQSSSAELIQRVHALKYRLSQELYHQLLEELYAKNPKASLAYFYNVYAENSDQYETPNPQDFIELHILARTLFSSIVLTTCSANTEHVDEEGHIQQPTQNILLRRHTIEDLLILASFKDEDLLEQLDGELPIDPLKKLTSLEDTSNSLIHKFNKINNQYKSKIAQLIDDSLPFRVKQDRKEHHHLMNQDKANGATPLTTLKDIFTYLKPHLHPLLIHLAYQACELEVLDFRKFKLVLESKDYPKVEYDELTQFLTQDLLKIWIPPVQHDISSLERLERQKYLLNPTTNIVTSSLMNAEIHAINLLLAHAISPDKLVDEAHQLCIQYAPLTKETTNWILYRLGQKDATLLPALNHIFLQATRYNLKNIISIALSGSTTEETVDIDEQISQIIKYLDVAITFVKDVITGKRTYINDVEEGYINTAIILFEQCLANPNLTSEHLDKLYNVVLPLLNRHYVHDDVIQVWEHQILIKQAKLNQWNEQDLHDIEDQLTCANLLIHTETNLGLAKEANQTKDKHFAQEHEYLQWAIDYFNQFIKNLSPQNVNAKDINHANQMLNRLKPYLSPTLTQSWSEELENMLTSLKEPLENAKQTASSNLGFFKQQNTKDKETELLIIKAGQATHKPEVHSTSPQAGYF